MRELQVSRVGSHMPGPLSRRGRGTVRQEGEGGGNGQTTDHFFLLFGILDGKRSNAMEMNQCVRSVRRPSRSVRGCRPRIGLP